MSSREGIGGLFMTFLLIVIALALTPTIADAAEDAVTALGAGAAATLCGLIPMFWVVIVLAIGVAAIYAQMRGF